jgi:hypothetical protein
MRIRLYDGSASVTSAIAVNTGARPNRRPQVRGLLGFSLESRVITTFMSRTLLRD